MDIGPYEFQHVITGTRDFLPDAAWQVYPNPANEKLEIRLTESATSGELRLIDNKGRILFTQVLENGQDDETLDVSKLSPGTYFVHLVLDGLQDVKKVVKQ